MNKPLILKSSSIKPGSTMTAPTRITLSFFNGQYVTHMQNMQDQGLYDGHYHDTQDEASIEFTSRCQKEGVVAA